MQPAIHDANTATRDRPCQALCEPPGADPHAWWCGEGRLEAGPYPIRGGAVDSTGFAVCPKCEGQATMYDPESGESNCPDCGEINWKSILAEYPKQKAGQAFPVQILYLAPLPFDNLDVDKP